MISSIVIWLLAGAGLTQDPAASAAAGAQQVVIPPLHQTIVITASPDEPAFDRRDAELFRRILFSRDDQLLHVLDAGISAGQHEGGGKSVEVRRFGFNLDHGGVNGGLKVLVDNVQQNQSTQGHGQGYLGALKSLSPELIGEVQIINGPFSPEYGDFSGLGVVHIRLRESLPDQWTARFQAGSFRTRRAFLAYSPLLKAGDAFVAYEGSRTDGPFREPLSYARDNVTANLTRRLSSSRSLGFRLNTGRNDFHSSGQLPLDEVSAGRLDRFGSLSTGDGGRGQSGTVGLHYRSEAASGAAWKADAFLARSLLDLYSNFTFFLNNPETGDAFQQHDSRLQQGANLQYLRSHRLAGIPGLLMAGANFHDNQINVGLYPRMGRTPTGVTTRAGAHVTNGAGYFQDTLSLLSGRLRAGLGLRYDLFRFGVEDRVELWGGATRRHYAGQVQPKWNVAFMPTRRWPLTLYAHYGRGISSSDARGVIRSASGRRLATTDFYQLGSTHQFGRVSLTTDLFWIDRSNELVYVPDDGSLEFMGPSRAYGYEAKASVGITRRLSLDGGVTKVANAFYRGSTPRVYVDRAPHFVANAGLALSAWRGWSGSLRMRTINHYRLDGQDPSVVASGHTVLDLSLVRRLRPGVEISLAVDNLTDRLYYETQNYFVSRLRSQAPRAHIHGTPGYPLTVTAGLTFRFRGK